MNWNIIKELKCPHCEKSLSFRLKGSFVNLKANKNFAKKVNDDFYFCSQKKCKGFQINKKKIQELKEKEKDFLLKIIPKRDKQLFKTGLIQLQVWITTLTPRSNLAKI